MNALPKLLLALTAAAVLSFIQPAKANLITNPGFETGDFTGWTLHSAFFVLGTTGGISPHSGAFQATNDAGGVALLGQTFATTLGQSYTVDFWAATSTGGVLSVLNAGNHTIFSHLFATQTGYTEFTFNFTATNASSGITFLTNGIFLLDDISVEPTGVGVPDGGTTASLLGCALVGLVGLRRRLGC